MGHITLGQGIVYHAEQQVFHWFTIMKNFGRVGVEGIFFG